MEKRIDIFKIYSDRGAGTRGSDLGSESILEALSKSEVESLGYTIDNILEIKTDKKDNLQTKLKNLEAVNDISLKLYNLVTDSLNKGNFPICLGGDHSLAIGSVSAIQRVHKNSGLIWVDAHGDFNNADTSPSGNIHGVPLSALTGNGPNEVIVDKDFKPIRECNTVLIGARDLDEKEKENLRNSSVTVFTMEDIDREGMSQVIEKAIKIASNKTSGIYLSFDLDAIEPSLAPAVGTPFLGGLTYRESRLLCESLNKSNKLLGFEIVELNPSLDINNQTSKIACDLIYSLLGKKLL